MNPRNQRLVEYVKGIIQNTTTTSWETLIWWNGKNTISNAYICSSSSGSTPDELMNFYRTQACCTKWIHRALKMYIYFNGFVFSELYVLHIFQKLEKLEFIFQTNWDIHMQHYISDFGTRKLLECFKEKSSSHVFMPACSKQIQCYYFILICSILLNPCFKLIN